MINYSIIIPHKNIPDRLQRCLDSIPERDDVQVIVVDDHSDTDKVDFEHFPQWKGQNYEYYLTEVGKGAGYARNVGLKYAKGIWILFADADDFFLDNFQLVLSEIPDANIDIVFFDAVAKMMGDAGYSHRVDHLNNMHELYDLNPQLASLRFRYLFGEPWCKLIRRDLINRMHICFDETSIHNDTTFSYLVGHYANGIGVNHSKIYCVTDSPGSVSKNQAIDVQFIRTSIFAKKNLFLYKHNIPLFDKYLLKPFIDCLKNKAWSCFFKCLFIARKYGFSPLSIFIRVYAPNWHKKLLRLGLEKRLKYSYDV